MYAHEEDRYGGARASGGRHSRGMKTRGAHKRLLAAHKLLLEPGSPKSKFNAVRTLMKGFRPELDRALESAEHGLSTVDGTSKSALSIKAIALSMTFELPSSIRAVTLDGVMLLGKKSTINLGDSKSHTLSSESSSESCGLERLFWLSTSH